jgi:hypothetical protein
MCTVQQKQNTIKMFNVTKETEKPLEDWPIPSRISLYSGGTQSLDSRNFR